jgi:hypothetical protein
MYHVKQIDNFDVHHRLGFESGQLHYVDLMGLVEIPTQSQKVAGILHDTFHDSGVSCAYAILYPPHPGPLPHAGFEPWREQALGCHTVS